MPALQYGELGEARHVGLRGIGQRQPVPAVSTRATHVSSKSVRRQRHLRVNVASEVQIDSAYTTDRCYEDTEAIVSSPQRSAKCIKSTAWPSKSSLYLFRTDGKSCSRELVTGNGKLHFAHPSTQQQLLVWRDRPKAVMVIKKLGDELLQEFKSVVSYLTEVERMHVVIEPHMYEQLTLLGVSMEGVFTFTQEESLRLADYIDFVCCLGGDGVILHASSLFHSAIPPVLSFHLGSMGFLTNHEYKDYKTALRQVIYGGTKLDTCNMDSIEDNGNGNRLGVMVTLRMRLECAIVRRGNDRPEQVYEVLNEIVLDRGSNSFLTNIECYISGRMITRVQADGIMLATPTGSTAYSVAAGGSMVHPNVPAILLTPICPHSLNFRPVVLPDYVELELRVPDSARVGAWVCFDGKRRQELHRGDRVFVKMSENPVPTINKEDLTGDWFESLDRCFRWSNRLEQKHLAVEYSEHKSATLPGSGEPVGLNGSAGVPEPLTPPAAPGRRQANGNGGLTAAEAANAGMKTITAAAAGLAQN